MSRIRSIKPTFWVSEQVIACDAMTRLLFIGMWNFADDYGRMPFSPVSIKAQVLPGDNIPIEEIRRMVLKLCEVGLILIYSANGKEYIEITGWSHQKIDKRQAAKYPAPFTGEAPTAADQTPAPAESPRLSPNAPENLPWIGEDRKGKDKIDDGGGDAGAITESPSFKLAEEIGTLCGFPTSLDWPPAFCGAPHRVATWLNEGWKPEIIRSAVKESLARKRDGPPDSINYFEKPIARAHAQASAPLPTVKIIEGQTTEVRRESRGNILPAADKLIEKLADFNRPAPDFARTGELRGGTGEAPIRLISKG